MQHGRPFLAKSQNVTNKHTRRTAYKFHPRFPFSLSFLRSTHRTVLLNLILSLIRVRRDFFISVASSLLQIEMDYSDGRFSFRSLYFPTALTHRYRGERISDGCNDNPKGFPFKRGLPSFSRISNGLSNGLWHTSPTLEPPFSELSLLSCE